MDRLMAMYSGLNIVLNYLWNCGVRIRRGVVSGVDIKQDVSNVLYTFTLANNEILQVAKIQSRYPLLATVLAPIETMEKSVATQLKVHRPIAGINELEVLHFDGHWSPSLGLPYHIHLDATYKNTLFVIGITLPKRLVYASDLYVYFALPNTCFPFYSLCPVLFTTSECLSYNGESALGNFFHLFIASYLKGG